MRVNVKLKNRRGAFTVLTAILALSLTGIGAIAIDFSRMWTLRNELQTSADAGAMSGAIELSPGHVAASAVASAQGLATANPAMASTVTVDSTVLGRWNPNSRVFTAGGTPTNAIHVVVSRPMSGLLMSMLGTFTPTLKARATAWAEAPVASAGCQRPWMVPYMLLRSRLNPYVGLSQSTADLTAAWVASRDMPGLQSMSLTDRTFTLKMGGGTVSDPLGAISGNYQIIQFPKRYDAATGTFYPYGTPVPGAGAYRDAISGFSPGCAQANLGPGDQVDTQTGNIPQNTVNGADMVWQNTAPQGNPGFGVCSSITDTNRNYTTHGDCYNAAGTVGVTIRSGFYMCTSGCNGTSVLTVTLLGSFKLTKVIPRNCHPSTGINCSTGDIQGEFVPAQAGGAVGSGATILVKPILVE